MLPDSFSLLPCCELNDLALNLRVIFQSVAALAAFRNPSHILMYTPRISSLAALPQAEIYSVKALWTDKKPVLKSGPVFLFVKNNRDISR